MTKVRPIEWGEEQKSQLIMIEPPYYSVVIDDRDDDGYGDYLHDASFPDLPDALDYLKSSGKCNKIAYWDGDEWHDDVVYWDGDDWVIRDVIPDDGNL